MLKVMLQLGYMRPKLPISLLTAVFIWNAAAVPAQEVLPGTAPLTREGDFSAQMVSGLEQFLRRETEETAKDRSKLWQRDFASKEAYEKSIGPNRERLKIILGVVDSRVPVTALEYVSSTVDSSLVAETDAFTIRAVRWPVLEGVLGEGLWVRPKTAPLARIIALPDADQTPEMVTGLAPGLAPERQFARRLAENGCEVLVPVLVDRQDTWSGNVALKKFTNQPHREWIYRQAFELGRHVVGYGIEKVMAAVDFLKAENSQAPA
ncbi:MAG: alpha/beta hydrolase family protein, partial [Limisphaerales bacterium]